MRCSQCHVDQGIKTKSGGIPQTVYNDAKWVVSVNGAKTYLCDTHKTKFEKATLRKKAICTSWEI